MPVAPGTAGSLAAVLMAYLLAAHAGWRPGYFAVLAAVWILPAIWAAGWVERESGILDPKWIVVDEVIGQWIAIAGATTLNWKSWLAAFALFRLFDIWKPGPIRKIQALKGGLGVIADDVLAGLAGWLVLFTAGCFNFY